jgi:hypothetical protein
MGIVALAGKISSRRVFSRIFSDEAVRADFFIEYLRHPEMMDALREPRGKALFFIMRKFVPVSTLAENKKMKQAGRGQKVREKVPTIIDTPDNVCTNSTRE